MRPELKAKIKRVSDGIWEIPEDYKPGMLVPARVFATERLLNEMDEGIFDQVTNVACLPGIQKHAYCMPDGHWGYGFPIGGVAAFDYETGIISPGGVGFDINCLVRGSNIMTAEGYTLPIEEFEHRFGDVTIQHQEYLLKSCTQSILSLDRDQKSLSPKGIQLFMKRKHSGQVLEIRTKLGYTISVTAEHPVLTPQGMVRAEQLDKEQSIAVYPFEGVPYEKPDDAPLVTEEDFTKLQRDELEKRNILPLTLNNPNIAILARLFGYLLGDGIIYFSNDKGYICAYGPEKDLEQMKQDFERLGFSARIYSRERDHSIPTRYGVVEFKARNYELHVSSSSLSNLFFALGYPKGNKTNTPFGVPPWIMQAPLWVKRLFLSGLFGAELSKPQTHTKTGFYCPTLSMNKNSHLLDDARAFCIQVMQLLEDFGVQTHILQERKDYFNRYGPTHRIKLMISAEETNLLMLWSRIGFSYNTQREQLSQLAILYIKEKTALTKKRREVAKRVKELRQRGLRLKEVQKLLESPITNKRFLERHYYENAGQRITLDFASFKDFAESKQRELDEYGCLFDSIEIISKKQYDDYVYDFTVPQTHNFIANNVIVSNCGVRAITTNLTLEDIKPKLKQLIDELFRTVPCGVGGHGATRLNQGELREMLVSGAKWCLDNSYAWKEDLERIEEGGCLPGADPDKVSQQALSRGIGQVGTLGSGNHYLEIQVVPEKGIFDKETAETFGITREGQVTVMIHCGSRGFGHQVATDYLRIFDQCVRKYNIQLKDRQLACAPFQSKEGQDYYAAMACAANMAFVNRQMILHSIRKGFSNVFKQSAEELGMHLVYDVCHNIAKIEEHVVDGKKRKLIVHRKGATRSFGPGHEDVQQPYRKTGQPVIIGGSMETGSYLLAGTQKAMEESFGSTCHGSGRTMSRTAAKKTVRGESILRRMAEHGIYVRAASMAGLAEEAGDAYKNISEVVKACELSGISRKVVMLKPIGNLKG